MRFAFVLMIVVGCFGVGLWDILHGQHNIGAAFLLLAAVNVLFAYG